MRRAGYGPTLWNRVLQSGINSETCDRPRWRYQTVHFYLQVDLPPPHIIAPGIQSYDVGVLGKERDEHLEDQV